jgi:hypothetical protein
VESNLKLNGGMAKYEAAPECGEAHESRDNKMPAHRIMGSSDNRWPPNKIAEGFHPIST